MRSEILFNDDWLYYPEQVDESVTDSEFEPVVIPHTNKLFPHHSFAERCSPILLSYLLA